MDCRRERTKLIQLIVSCDLLHVVVVYYALVQLKQSYQLKDSTKYSHVSLHHDLLYQRNMAVPATINPAPFHDFHIYCEEYNKQL